MTDKKMFYWSLTPIPRTFDPAQVALPEAPVLFFSTERKLEKWKKKNPSLIAETTWHKHEISLSVAKDLIKLSKNKEKHRCEECGR